MSLEIWRVTLGLSLRQCRSCFFNVFGTIGRSLSSPRGSGKRSVPACVIEAKLRLLSRHYCIYSPVSRRGAEGRRTLLVATGAGRELSHVEFFVAATPDRCDRRRERGGRRRRRARETGNRHGVHLRLSVTRHDADNDIVVEYARETPAGAGGSGTLE